MSVDVRIDQFEGPLDLLLYLVHKDEVDPRTISMNSICDQFIAFLQKMHNDDLAVAGEFMEMAARLMALKAQELLPRDERQEEGDFDFDLDREEILRQILVYSKFKDVATGLRGLEDENFGCYSRGRAESLRTQTKDPEETEADAAGVFELYEAFFASLKRRAQTAVHTIEIDHVTIEDRQQAIENFILFQGKATFTELTGGLPDRILAAVTFMALLEMVKLDHVVLRQPVFADELLVYRKKENETFADEMARDVIRVDAEVRFRQGLAALAREKAKNQKREEDLDDVLRALSKKALEGEMVTESEIEDRLMGRAGQLSWAENWAAMYQEEALRRLSGFKRPSPWERRAVVPQFRAARMWFPVLQPQMGQKWKLPQRPNPVQKGKR